MPQIITLPCDEPQTDQGRANLIAGFGAVLLFLMDHRDIPGQVGSLIQSMSRSLMERWGIDDKLVAWNGPAGVFEIPINGTTYRVGFDEAREHGTPIIDHVVKPLLIEIASAPQESVPAPWAKRSTSYGAN